MLTPSLNWFSEITLRDRKKIRYIKKVVDYSYLDKRLLVIQCFKLVNTFRHYRETDESIHSGVNDFHLNKNEKLSVTTILILV